ncbi:hypothetical protein AGMMS49938_06060 [Fibrobacterales bacterium]|nr:hypothetical protein AGMMS49938_06060 [Fibrobacterales bacterium]
MFQSGKKFTIVSLAVVCAAILFFACGNHSDLEVNDGDKNQSQVQCVLETSCTSISQDLCLAAGGTPLETCPFSSSSAGGIGEGNGEDTSSSSVAENEILCLIQTQFGASCNKATISACSALSGTTVDKCPALSSSSSAIASSSSKQSSSSAGGTSSAVVSSSSAVVQSSSSAASGTGSCITRNGTVPANPTTTCFAYENKCYTCNSERAADCAQSWLWQNNPPAGNVPYWYTEITCAGGGGGTSSAASSSSKASSSSVVASSSSTAASSSSVAGVTLPTLTEGGAGVSKGYATRYWDACKASCSWSGKQYASWANKATKQCSSNGTTELTRGDDNQRSACDGGNSYTCFDQTPRIVNDNLAYIFAATPGDQCGKCYQVQFTGKCNEKYDAYNCPKLNGKTLIVIGTNTGYDVDGNQFDLMIPGGGVGAFDAFSSQIGVSKSTLGAQYGGLLDDCMQSNGWNGDAAKSCLVSKCNSVFSGNSSLKEGCLFLANWMNSENNPAILFKETTCPDYLKSAY